MAKKTQVLKKTKEYLKNKCGRVCWIVSGVVAFILVVVLVFGIGIYGLKWDNKPTQIASEIIPYPATIINYTNWVFAGEFLENLASLKQYYNKTQNIDFSTQDGQKKLKEIRKNLIDQLVEKEIIALEAKNYGIIVSRDEVDKEYKDIVESNGGEEKVRQQVKDYYNWTVEDFKNKIGDNLLERKLEQKISTDERINEAARNQANDILSQAKGGADFAKLALKYSQDPTAASGGDLGFVSKGTMELEFEKATFSLKKGEIYPEIVKTRYGYHIIKCIDKKGNLVRVSHILIRVKDFRGWLADKKKEYRIWQFIKE